MKYLASILFISATVILAGCTITQPVDDSSTNLNQADSAGVTNTVAETNVNESDTIDTVTQNNNETDIADGTIGNTNEDNATDVDTSDWLTYTNEEYGFSFRYPEDWEINDYTQFNLFMNVTDQVLRLQFNVDQTEYHMVLFKNKTENVIEQIKNDDPAASFVKVESKVNINAKSYQYISILAAIGSMVDYYIESYNSKYTVVWIANPYTDQDIIHTWISTFH